MIMYQGEESVARSTDSHVSRGEWIAFPPTACIKPDYYFVTRRCRASKIADLQAQHHTAMPCELLLSEPKLGIRRLSGPLRSRAVMIVCTGDCEARFGKEQVCVRVRMSLCSGN